MTLDLAARDLAGWAAAAGGSGADRVRNVEALVGSGFADRLGGTDGANRLHGGGGADTLTGGRGADAFVFDTAPGAADLITDFTSGTDRIVLDHAAFAALPPGVPALFGVHVLHDAATGTLSYDADGAGGAAALAFATLGAGVAVVAGDLWVV